VSCGEFDPASMNAMRVVYKTAEKKNSSDNVMVRMVYGCSGAPDFGLCGEVE
jgi:hypothetical protein